MAQGMPVIFGTNFSESICVRKKDKTKQKKKNSKHVLNLAIQAFSGLIETSMMKETVFKNGLAQQILKKKNVKKHKLL